LMPSYLGMFEFYRARDFYLPEQRHGRYLISWRVPKLGEDGQPVRNEGGQMVMETATHSAIDQKSLQGEINRVMENEGLTREEIKVTDKKDLDPSDAANHFMDERVIQLFTDIETAEFDSAIKELGQREGVELIEKFFKKFRYTPGVKIAEEFAQRTQKNFEKRRQFKAGRNYVDMWQAVLNQTVNVSHSVTLGRAKRMNNIMLDDQKLVQQPQIKKLAQAYADNMTSQGSKEYTTLKNGIFAYWLGFNISSALIETSQPLLTLLPHLVRQTGGLGQSLKMMTRAAGTLKDAYTKRGLRGKTLEFDDKELQGHFGRAMDEGILAFGSLDEIVSPNQIDALMMSRAAKGKPGINPIDLAKNAAHHTMHSAKAFYSLASGTGAKLGFLTNWELGKSRGLKGESLYAFAKQGVAATSFSGGRANIRSRCLIKFLFLPPKAAFSILSSRSGDFCNVRMNSNTALPCFTFAPSGSGSGMPPSCFLGIPCLAPSTAPLRVPPSVDTSGISLGSVTPREMNS